MSFMLIIAQPEFIESEVAAVVRAAIAVLALRAEATASPLGTFVKRGRTEQSVSFVRLATTGDQMSASGLVRALESALTAAGLERAEVQVLDERPA